MRGHLEGLFHWRKRYYGFWTLFLAILITSQDITQQAQDINITSGWRWTWRLTDIAFWLRMKIGLTAIFNANLTLTYCWNLVTQPKNNKYQHQLMSVLDIKLTLPLDIELTLDFGHPMSQQNFYHITTNQCLKTLSACWVIDWLELCRLLVDYRDVFIRYGFGLSFWWHPFTADDPLVSKSCNAIYLHMCSNEETN